MSDETAFKLGKNEADILTLKDDVKAMRADIAQLLAYQQQARGGYRMLVAVGGIGGAVGAGLIKLLAVFAKAAV